MEKNIYYIELFDIYGDLLTEKQREIFTSHYIFDLSLAEIAEPNGKTRQSVYDAIKGVCDKLIQYERALKVYEKNKKIEEILGECKDENLCQKLNEIIGK